MEIVHSTLIKSFKKIVIYLIKFKKKLFYQNMIKKIKNFFKTLLITKINKHFAYLSLINFSMFITIKICLIKNKYQQTHGQIRFNHYV